MKSKEELKREALEAYEKVQAPAWEAYEKRLAEIDALAEGEG